jgi:hypothetical protein
MPITLFTILALLIIFLFPGTTVATVFLIIASIFAVIIAVILLFVTMIVALVDHFGNQPGDVKLFKETINKSFKTITSTITIAMIIAASIYMDLVTLPVIWMINIWCIISIKVMQRKWRKEK